MRQDRNGSLKWARTVIGVALGNGGRVAAVRGERRGRRVLCMAVDRDEAAKMVSEGVPCVGHMSARQTIARWFEAPFESKWKARRVIPTLVDIHLPFALEDSCHVVIPGRKGLSGRCRYLAIAARVMDIRRRIEELAAAGFEPAVLDHEGLSLWSHSIAERKPSSNGVVRIVVNADGDSSALAFGTPSEFLSVHSWRTSDPASAARIVRACRMALSASDLKAEWAWCGPDVADAAFVEKAREALAGEWSGSYFVHDDPAFFLSRALASRSLSDGPFRCNLRVGPFVHEVIAARERRVTARSAVALCGVSLFLLGAALCARLLVSRAEAELDRTFSAIASDAAGFPVVGRGQHALKIVEDSLTRRQHEWLPFVNRAGPSLLDLLGPITREASSNSLQIVSLNLDRTKISMSGIGRDWLGCERMAAFLRDLGYQPRLDRKDAGADGLVPFAIETADVGGARE